MPDAAFAILFLMRSTKKSIEKSKGFEAGILAGGQGLPVRLTDARLHEGRIVGKRVIGTPDGLLDTLSQPDNADFSDLAADPQDLIRQMSEEDEAAQTAHLARLRRLVTAGPARSRLAAVEVLAKLRDVANVPTLIAALSDSEWSVVYQADQALRFISRAVGKDDLTELPDESARAAAVQKLAGLVCVDSPRAGEREAGEAAVSSASSARCTTASRNARGSGPWCLAGEPSTRYLVRRTRTARGALSWMGRQMLATRRPACDTR